ncbi:hypothetical protein Agub_g14254, partial [Astrephomene gubernaculifera]
GVDVAGLRAEPCELQVVLLPFGKDKADLDDYQRYSGPPEGKALQRWVTGAVPLFAATLDDSAAEAFLALDPSGGSMAGAPKVVLFTNKEEAPGVFRALALAMRGRGNMAFGWVQVGSPASQRLVQSFKPPRVPFMTVILPTRVPPPKTGGATKGGKGGKAGGSSSGREAPAIQYGSQPYLGPLRFGPMRQFLEEMATQLEVASGIVKDAALAEKALPQISSPADFRTHCASQPGLCLLGLLDSPSAPTYQQERKELLGLAVRMQLSGEGGAMHFGCLEGRKHPGVMQAFGLLSSDLPSLVALSPSRMRFAVLPAGGGEEEEEGEEAEVALPGASSSARLSSRRVARFIRGVMSGKVRTAELHALPDFRDAGGDGPAAAAEGASAATSSDSTAAAAAAGGGGADAGGAAVDGGAEVVVVEADEFDLSDILSEEVEGSGAAAGLVGGKADRLRLVEEQLRAEEEAARKAAEEAAKGSGGKKKKKKKSGKKGKKGGSSGGEEL